MAATSSQAGTRALILMLLLAVLPQVAAADPGGNRHGRTYGTGQAIGNAINERSEIVGASSIPNGDIHAF